MTKREMLEHDLKEWIKYCQETIEEAELCTDGLDNWHRGQLAAFKAVLRNLDLIDEQVEIDEKLNKMLGL